MDEKLKQKIDDVLMDVYDPELHVDIYSLGLIYEVTNPEDKKIHVLMTLTFPGCPYGPNIVEEVKSRVKEEVDGVEEVEVKVTFDPAWSPDKIDPDIRAAIGF